MKTQSALINPVKLPDDLNEAERHFVRCMATGMPCMFGTTRPKPDDKNAPVIRAAVIGFFVWGGSEENPILGNRIHLQGARVRGVLDLDYYLSPYMLVMAHCHFSDDISMSHSGFRLLGLTGSRLKKGLMGSGLQIDSDLLMIGGFSADEAVHLLDANIGGNLRCDGGEFKQGARAAALIADRIKVGGNVSLVGNFSAKGCARFLGANIGGYFACDNGKFSQNKKGWALAADGIKIENELFMGNGFWAEGLVRFPGARINGGVDGSKGEFGGMVSFEGAKIGGDLSFKDSVFRNDNGLALSADTIKVGGNVHLHGKFFSAGEVRFLSADIGGSLSCLGGTFQRGFTVGGAKIKDRVIWRETKGAGVVNFADASAGIFSDDESRKAFDFILRGFVYSQFHDPADVKSRIVWLMRRSATVPFSPQPFEQAAKALFAMGRGDDARKILFAMEQCVTKEQKFPEQDTFWSRVKRRGWLGLRWFGEHVTGYNHLLWRMVRTSAAIILTGAAIFYLANHCGYIVPHQPVVLANFNYKAIVRNEKAHVDKCAAPKRPRLRPTEAAECLFPGYPRFDAIWFSMDIFLPTSPLHQELYWYPHPHADSVWRYLLLGWYWFQVISGWVLTSIFALTITGIMQRSQASWSGK